LKIEKSDWGWFLGAVSLSVLILLPTLWYGFGADHGLFSYGAWRWRKFGELPYVGIFDHNFPGIFLICYFIQETLGESVIAFRAFDLVWQICTALTIYKICVSVFRNYRAGLLAVILYGFFYLKLGPWDSGQRDGFLLLFYLLGFDLIRGTKDGDENFIRILLAGLLIGFALLVKPVAGLIGLVLMGMVWKSGTRLKLVHIFCFALMMFLPFLLVLGYYWLLGHIQELHQALFVFSRIYLGVLFMPMIVRIARMLLLEIFLRNPLILIGLLLYLFSWRLRRGNSQSLDWRLKIFALGIYLSYLSQGKFFHYHQIPVFGLLSIFAGMGYAEVLAVIEERWKVKQRVAILVMGGVLFLEPLVITPEIAQFFIRSLRVRPSQAHQLYPFQRVCSITADYIKSRTQPDDKVQVWGGEALINYLARRNSPTRFPSTLYMEILSRTNSHPELEKELTGEFLRALKSNPPVYFLVETLSHKGFGIDSDKQALIKGFPQIYQFLNEHYYLEAKIDFVECWRLKKNSRNIQ